LVQSFYEEKLVASRIQDFSRDERLKRVEETWDSIAVEQAADPMTPEQSHELDGRLDAYRGIGDSGDPASGVIEEIRSRL
jgi:putative addiction module component (TIGR02574 family)